jgi:tetratricopeptide (TPR) repeat protein
MQWCRRAMTAAPQEPKYSYTVAFFERQQSHLAEAIGILQKVVQRHPTHTDSVELLGQIYLDQGDQQRAKEIFEQAAGNPALPADARAHFAQRVNEATQPGRD